VIHRLLATGICCVLITLHPMNTQAQIAPIKTVNAVKAKKTVFKGDNALEEAKKANVPTSIGEWKLVRHVAGEHAHFLYANDKRSFSFFITETQNTRPLTAQKGWRRVTGTGNFIAFLHQDARDASRTALVFKYQAQRRMIVGKLSLNEMLALAQKANLR
jgi:hypothetical protein